MLGSGVGSCGAVSKEKILGSCVGSGVAFSRQKMLGSCVGSCVDKMVGKKW